MRPLVHRVAHAVCCLVLRREVGHRRPVVCGEHHGARFRPARRTAPGGDVSAAVLAAKHSPDRLPSPASGWLLPSGVGFLRARTAGRRLGALRGAAPAPDLTLLIKNVRQRRRFDPDIGPTTDAFGGERHDIAVEVLEEGRGRNV